jgi:hypothetical protein
LTMRQLAVILFFFAAVLVSAAGETNYFCILCGKGPLAGKIWMSKWGAVCDDCYRKYPDRCSICGLPISDGFVKTPDGRFICKFDKTNAVFTADEAKEIFTDTRHDVVEMYGQGFALQFPDVAVNVFDVDYWSEKGRTNNLDKFGFAHTRKTADGQCTHEVVLLSGRTREEVIATAAHEYTHLWINENCPTNHVIDGDTVEAICELTAYKLMEEKNLPEAQKRILENPYTNGKIKTLVDVERDYGIGYILSWVKNGVTESLENADGTLAVAAPSPVVQVAFVPPQLPKGLKFSGQFIIGNDRQAVINGLSFAPGDQKRIKLRDKTVTVRCREIHDADVVVQVGDLPDAVTLKKGEEKLLP